MALEIPIGQTPEIIAAREAFILDYYDRWIAVNPEWRIYNACLSAFIYLDAFPVREIAPKASQCRQTTLAIAYMTEILECANEKVLSAREEVIGRQLVITQRLSLLYTRPLFGTVRLTLDSVKRKGKKEDYCLTGIDFVIRN